MLAGMEASLRLHHHCPSHLSPLPLSMQGQIQSFQEVTFSCHWSTLCSYKDVHNLYGHYFVHIYAAQCTSKSKLCIHLGELLNKEGGGLLAYLPILSNVASLPMPPAFMWKED